MAFATETAHAAPRPGPLDIRHAGDGWKVFDAEGQALTRPLSTCAAAVEARARISAKAEAGQ